MSNTTRATEPLRRGARIHLLLSSGRFQQQLLSTHYVPSQVLRSGSKGSKVCQGQLLPEWGF